MKYNLNPIKKKILEETQKEREQIQNIYEKSCKKAKKNAWIKRLTVLVSIVIFLFVLRIICYYDYPAVAMIIGIIVCICCVPFIVMTTEGDISFYDDSLENILKKNIAYQKIIQAVEKKKNQIMREDIQFTEYLASLKDVVRIYMLNNCLSFVESYGNQDRDVKNTKEGIQQSVESAFETSRFLLFDDLYTKIYFVFSHSDNGKSLLGTKKTFAVSLDDDDIENGTIRFESWENCW
jgi:hypothetical protein